MTAEERVMEGSNGFEPKMLIVPLIIIVIVIGTVIGIANYINNRKATETPNVEIMAPADGDVVETETVLIEGKTDDEARIYINGKEVSVDDKTGNFSKEVNLTEGDNSIGIVAESKSGKRSEATIRVTKTAIFKPQNQSVQPVAGADLTTSGPENYFLPEISALSLVGAGWYASKKKLAKTIKR